jgi:hypothetical protein
VTEVLGVPQTTLLDWAKHFPPVVAGRMGQHGAALYSPQQSYYIALAASLSELTGRARGFLRRNQANYPRHYAAAEEDKFVRDLTSEPLEPPEPARWLDSGLDKIAHAKLLRLREYLLGRLEQAERRDAVGT